MPLAADSLYEVRLQEKISICKVSLFKMYSEPKAHVLPLL